MQLDEQLAKLTEAERSALRLLLRHTDVNLVARELNISPSAVDKRLQAARRKLAVSRSLDAALLLAQHEGSGRTIQVAVSPATIPTSDPAKADLTERGSDVLSQLLPSRGRPWNVLPAWARLAWMAALLLMLAIAMLVIVSVQTVLTEAFGS